METDLADLIGGNDEVLARLAAALIAGFVLGINRELRGKPAGVRTHGLVAIGACLVTIVSMEIASIPNAFNPDTVSRVVQGVITGIGFIGGGVILKLPESRAVQGLTTAASVWVTACIAVAFGAGMWRSAWIGLLLTMVALLLGGPIENLATRLLKGRHRPSGWEGD
ncbi:MAG TPA: MgtC/SapB family protein [Gemmatimonadales bacterium]